MRARLWPAVLAAAAAAAAAAASAAGARPELSTEFFLVPEAPRPATRAPPGPAAPTLPPPPPTCLSAANCTAGGAAAAEHDGVLRRETWVVPLLVVCSVSALLMLGFEVFVVCKARQTAPSRRHLFLGQTLLLGLLLCAAVAAVAAATPTPAVCATIRMGAGVSYAVVFSALLVKCVFLISLNGGVYLPAAYQALLLAFAVLTQVAVGVQWLLASPPAAELRPLPPLLHGGGERWVWSCRSPYAHLVASLSYCGALLLLVAVLAVKSRAIRDNYREATFIGLSAGAAVLIAAAWLLAGLLLATPPQRDACVAFGLVATAAVVFLVMFMPKGRQLAAMGRDGLYAEDRDDRLSSLSRAASPSFFHFTPAHHPQPPPPPPPHKAPVPPGLTDQVAVVGQVPSYARMLHYYPYCYYPRYACPCTPAPAPAPAPLPNSGDQYHAGAAPRWKSGLYLKPDDSNLYTTVEPTLSSNPNVFFQRSGSTLASSTNTNSPGAKDNCLQGHTTMLTGAISSLW